MDAARLKKRPRPALKAGLSVGVKQRLGHGVNQVAIAWEPRFKREVKRQFNEDRETLLDLLRKGGAKVNWQDVQHQWQEYFDEEGLKRWKRMCTPLLRGVTTDVDAMWETFFSQAKMVRKADPQTIFANQAFMDYLITFAQPIMDTTNLDCVAILQTAAAEGWAIPEMEEALGVLFDSYIKGGGLTQEQLVWFMDRIPRYRLENIARTETQKAANWSSWQTFKNFGVQYKEWLATLDGRQRATHETAMSMYSVGGKPGPIPIDEPFIVGGTPMMYPGDGPPSEACNCRCTSLPWNPNWASL